MTDREYEEKSLRFDERREFTHEAQKEERENEERIDSKE
jgi:hypothetical protein